MSVLSIYGLLTPYGGFYGYNIYMSYKSKYLKYKTKYLQLKGGQNEYILLFIMHLKRIQDFFCKSNI